MAAFLRSDNHFVPRVYLKRWSTQEQKIWTYRTLVSHPKVPLWREQSTKGVASHSHLYTQVLAGEESDQIERWLDREFETPAEEALDKATSDKRLTPDDWRKLVRFLAAQDVRTPTRLSEALRRWETEIPKLLDRTLKNAVRKLETARESGQAVAKSRTASDRSSFPIRVTTQVVPGEATGTLKAEILSGRALWLAPMKRLLTKTATIPHKHHWTILSPPPGLRWFTSDDPVLCLNYYSEGKYDFKGGWNNKGTEILLPIGPGHLLYTQVGKRPPCRGEIMPRATLVRRLIAEHATRMIFALEPDPSVAELRPRLVDAVQFRNEMEQGKRWSQEQTAAERKFREKP
jgi:hypothetical protein